jgi:hypothetical protein
MKDARVSCKFGGETMFHGSRIDILPTNIVQQNGQMYDVCVGIWEGVQELAGETE